MRVLGCIQSVVAGVSRGFGGDGGPAASASLIAPQGIAFDHSGNMYIADTGNNRIRKVTHFGNISTVAGDGYVDGTGNARYNGDGIPAISASLYYPCGVACDASGNIFIADMQNNRVREVSATGYISTVAGNGTGSLGDGGPAISATLSYPMGLAFDSSGNLYIADTARGRIRKVDFWPALDAAVSPSGAGILTIGPEGAGPSGSYAYGDKVDLSVSVNSGFRFTGWTGNVADNTSTSTTITLSNKDESVTANFIPTYKVSASSNPVVGGSVAGDGRGRPL